MTEFEIIAFLREIVILYPRSKFDYQTDEELDKAIETFERLFKDVTYEQAIEQLDKYVKGSNKYEPRISDLIPGSGETTSSECTIPNAEQTKRLLEERRREYQERRSRESEEEREALRHEFLQRAEHFGRAEKRNRKIVIDLGTDDTTRH